MTRKKTHFKLQGFDEDSDHTAISIAIAAARRFLKVPSITAKQILLLNKALFALRRLPQTTRGIHVQFGLCIDTPTEVRYLDFLISEHMFQISHGGAVDRGAGYDTYSLPGWHIETNGYRETEATLRQIEDYIEAYLADGAKITTHDENEIETHL